MKNIKIFTLLYIPFLINDLFFIYAYRYEAWLFIDYLFKIFVLYMAIYFVEKKEINFASLGFKILPIKRLVFWTILLSTTGIFIDQFAYAKLSDLMGSWKLFSFPIIDNSLVENVDLTIGLLLTAVSEEVVFRGVLILLFLNFFRSALPLVLISSLLFGLAHWGLGAPLILSAALWGILPAISVIKTRSIYPAIIAHYLTNFVDFSSLAH